MRGTPAPGWYPDPGNPAVVRWWDGIQWSGETRMGPARPGGDPAAGVTGGGGQPGPAAAVTGAGGGDAAGLQAPWREPALESWAAAYRSAGAAGGRDTAPVRRWLLGARRLMSGRRRGRPA